MAAAQSAQQRSGLAHRLRELAETTAATAGARNDDFACLTLLLTYRCPAMCAHCVFESSPSNTVTLDVEIARRAIAAIARQRPAPTLSFSGGEPFLQLATMKTLASFGFERGMVSEVVTSAAWVADRPRAAGVLRDLQSRGLRVLCVSYDRYHAPYVDAAKVKNAILAAREIGLRVVVNTMVDAQHDRDAATMLEQELELPREIIDSCFVNRMAVTPVGRARREVTDYVYSEGLRSRGCEFAGKTITISPRGDLYPCCGPVIGEEPGGAGLLIQENLSGRSVDEIAGIFESLKNDLFFNLLSTVGPYGILQHLRKRNPALATRRYVGQCDACLEFASNPDVAAATRDWLREVSNGA
jgi:hypothetical protein